MISIEIQDNRQMVINGRILDLIMVRTVSDEQRVFIVQYQ